MNRRVGGEDQVTEQAWKGITFERDSSDDGVSRQFQQIVVSKDRNVFVLSAALQQT